MFFFVLFNIYGGWNIFRDLFIDRLSLSFDLLPGFGKYLSTASSNLNPTVNSPTKAKPACGVIVSLVISNLNGSKVDGFVKTIFPPFLDALPREEWLPER